jgi:hypothetical protein
MSKSSSSSKKRGNDTVFEFAQEASTSSKDGGKRQKKDTKDKATAMAALNDVNIQKLLESKGPVVKCVLLRADGSEEEMDVDMTPSLGKCQEILGGALTFLGQWEDLQVVILISKPDPANDLPPNKHKLQHPFSTEMVFGDILLTRSDDDGEAGHFDLTEYTTFRDKVITAPAAGEEEESDASESDDDSDDSGGEVMTEEEALAMMKLAFTQANGRKPTKAEFEELKSEFLADQLEADEDGSDGSEGSEGSDGSEDEDGDEGEVLTEEQALAMVLPSLKMAFAQENGREPTEEEVEELSRSYLADGPLDEDEDDEREAALEAIMDEIVPQMVASYVEQNGREPTDEVLTDLKTRLRNNIKDAQEEGDEDFSEGSEDEYDENGEEA